MRVSRCAPPVGDDPGTVGERTPVRWPLYPIGCVGKKGLQAGIIIGLKQRGEATLPLLRSSMPSGASLGLQKFPNDFLHLALRQKPRPLPEDLAVSLDEEGAGHTSNFVIPDHVGILGATGGIGDGQIIQ